MTTYAVDFETYYDKKCSIRTLGVMGYFTHPDFDAYLVSVVGSDGYEFVGNPRDFDWSMLEDQLVLSHNASFDETLYLFGAKQGWWPLVSAKEWHCTADLAAYCGHPRSLKKASAEVLDVDLSKATRDNMRGKRWDSMTPEFQKEVLEYVRFRILSEAMGRPSVKVARGGKKDKRYKQGLLPEGPTYRHGPSPEAEGGDSIKAVRRRELDTVD